MKISNIFLLSLMCIGFQNIYAEDRYYVWCSHLDFKAETASFSPVRSISIKNMNQFNNDDLVSKYAEDIGRAGRTACYGGSNYSEVDDGRDRGIKFSEDNHWKVVIVERSGYFEYLRRLYK